MTFIDSLIERVGAEVVQDALLALEAAGYLTIDRSKPDGYYAEATPALLERVNADGTTAEQWKRRRDTAFE